MSSSVIYSCFLHQILDVMLRVFNEKGNTKLAIPVHESQLPEMPKKDP